MSLSPLRGSHYLGSRPLKPSDFVRSSNRAHLTEFRTSPTNSSALLIRHRRRLRRIRVPAATEGAVEPHQIADHEAFGLRQIVLPEKERTLGIEHVLKIRQARRVLGQNEIE